VVGQIQRYSSPEAFTAGLEEVSCNKGFGLADHASSVYHLSVKLLLKPNLNLPRQVN
jgi:hypothetical protein